MKHKVSFFAILAMALGPIAFAYDFSAVAPSGQTLYYNIVSGGAQVTSQNTSFPYYTTYPTGDLTIPSSVTHNGTTYSVTSIGDYAFRGCSDLTSLTIGNSVTSIGDWAFDECWGLTGPLTIPNSVTNIGEHAFYNCSGLTSLTIPNSVINIGDEAFSYCYGLTSVTIPNSVTSIGSHAFSWCVSLTSVTIPNSVTSIGFNPFSFCENLTSITVDNGNTVYDSRNNCNAIIETASNTLIAGCQNTVIPNSVTSIRNVAFYGCFGLTSMTIPNSVTSIGVAAFWGCGLTSLTIPNSVISIGDYAFSSCIHLTSVTIPNSVTSIGLNPFTSCDSLTSITVDNGNTVYDSRNNCNAIIETASNTLIAGCQNTVIPNSVTSIGSEAFSGCYGLTSLTIPNSVTSIGSEAFSRCYGLTSLTIPNSVTSIGSKAFSGCGLTSLAIPNSVTSIGDSVFYGCSGLTSLAIPNSVTGIGDFAFYECYNLAEVICRATTPPSLGEGAFYSILPSCTLTVPCGSEQAYQASDWGRYFSTIQCEEVGIDDVAWEGIEVALQGSTLTIHGATGEPVTITDLMGRCLYSARATESTHVALPSAGVYFVRVGDRPARKVVAARR